MRTVFLSFFPAYPPDSGAGSVTFNCAKHMPGEKWLIQLGQGPEKQQVGKNLILYNMAWSKSPTGKIFRLPIRIYKMVRLCRQINPDLIVLEGASWVMYHWLLLKGLCLTGLKAKIVYHSHNVEYELRRQKHGKIVTGLTFWAEKKLFHHADQSYACSEVDRHHVESLYGMRPAVLPNGVDAERFEQISENEISRIRRLYGLQGELLLFMGMYDYRPNREAIDFLIQQVMPRIIGLRPKVRLVLLGGKAPYEKPWLIQPGRIPHEDLPAFVKACGIGLAPIFSGSGTRLKILEYMAAGLPVVATPKGAEGLEVIDTQHLLLADDAHFFSESIISLMNSQQMAGQLGKNAQQTVQQNYSWPSLMSDFLKHVKIDKMQVHQKIETQ